MAQVVIYRLVVFLVGLDHFGATKVKFWIWCFWPWNYIFRGIQQSVWSGLYSKTLVLVRSMIGIIFSSVWEHLFWLDFWTFLEECDSNLKSWISHLWIVWLVCYFRNLFRTIGTLMLSNYSFYLAVVLAIKILMSRSKKFSTILD